MARIGPTERETISWVLELLNKLPLALLLDTPPHAVWRLSRLQGRVLDILIFG